MFALHRTLSLRYFSRRWFRALLIVASIMLGVATLVATRSLSETMNKALLAGANPMAGTIDLIVTNGDLNVDRDLIDDIRKIPAVKSANPRIFDQAKIVVGDKKLPVMVMGVDLSNDMKDFEEIQEHFEYSKTALVDYGLARQKDKIPVILGKDLDDELKNHKDQLEVFKIDLFVVKTELTLLSLEKGLDQQHKVARVGWMALKDDAKERDKYAAFAGHVVIMDLPHAATVVGLRPVDTRNVKLDLLAPPGGMAWGLLASSLADRRWKVRRIDIALTPGTDLKTARKKIEAVLSGRGVIRTMEEQNQSLQSATVGMQTAFSMCGVAALIVGMFLVYNSLSVSVAERRHEIGILLALGATRDQVWRLFAGEAFVMGAVGAALGLPLGIGLANLGLEPMQEAIGDVFTSMNARQVELNWEIVAQAFAVGILSAVVASMVPAVQAAYDNPAEAVRRVPKDPPITYLVLHILTTVLLIGGGMSMILMRDVIPRRWGTYGGLGLVMIGTLLAAPLIAQVLARMLIPVSRRFFSIEWRLAADNLVRAPGRTGMVIGALAAGVCLIVETAGIIRSNRQAIMEWVDSPTTSDIMVTSGSPIGSSGQSNLMEENIGDELGGIPGVELALPSRLCTDIPFRGVRVAINTLVADKYFPVAKRRLDVHRSSNPAYSAADYEKKVRELELVREMDRPTGDSEIAGNVIVSGNFAALHGVDKGGFVTLTSSKKELKFRVLGTIEDYTWNLGTIIMNRRDYVRYWQDTKVTWFEVYIQPGADPVKVKTAIATKLSKYDLQPLTHSELRTHIEQIIERLYAIAKGQQIVVMIVASLGVVTALLISVLHQRREMGLLRAIGASQAQVVYLVLAEAALMGVLGAFLGFLFAIPLQWYALRIVFLEEAGYIFPVTIPWLESAIIVLSAIVLATAAGIGPALYGVSERIPDAIAYE